MLGLSDYQADTLAAKPAAPASPLKEARRLLRSRTPLAVATRTIAVLNVAVYLAMVLFGVSAIRPRIPDLVNWGAEYGPLTTNGEAWRLLTSQFLHAGIAHVLGNLFALMVIGPVVERLISASAFVALYIACGLVASAASLAVHPWTVSVGASGAIMGVYGVLLAILFVPARSVDVPSIPVSRLSVFVGPLVGGILGTLAVGLFVPSVNNTAHVAGLVAGVVFGGLLGRRVQSRTIAPSRAAVTVVVGVVACVGALWFVGPLVDTRTAIIEALTFESTANVSYTQMLRRKAPAEEIAATIEREILPPFTAAQGRLSARRPLAGDAAVVEQLQAFVASREEIWRDRAEGHRANRPDILERADALEAASDELRKRLLYVHPRTRKPVNP